MTQDQAIKKALEKAQSDLEFRNRLMSNPESTLKSEFPSVSFSGKIDLDFELSDDELDMVSGGLNKDGSGGTTMTTTTSSPSMSFAADTGAGGGGSGSSKSGSSSSSKSSKSGKSKS